MFRNHSALLRTVSVLALGSSWALACTAPSPVPGDGDETSTDTNQPTTENHTNGISLGDGDGDLGSSDLGGDGDGDTNANCGDGVRDEGEACDDGTPGGGDGCSADCSLVEPGYLCREEGTPCQPYSKCGDGVKGFAEQCDDAGNTAPGCSDLCKLDLGYKCDGEPSVCTPTVCGDGATDGTETCEDGNTVPFDGCDAQCNKEPDCKTTSGMGCTSSCGDGLIIGDEACDDGNAQDGDGCSSTCQQEMGYTCSVPQVDPNQPLDLPIVFRDFNSGAPTDFRDAESGPVEDWECNGYSRGIAMATLNPDGKPVYAASPAKSCVTAAGFPTWYVDSAQSATVLGSVRLFPDGNGGYVNRMNDEGDQFLAADPDDPDEILELDGNPLFFPVDDAPNAKTPMSQYTEARIPAQVYQGVGWPWEAGGTDETPPAGSPQHNFQFTSEIAYWFEYSNTMAAELTFIGDDDVFVFVNRKLVLDLGGIHVPLLGRFTLSAGGAIATHIEEPLDPGDEAPVPMPDIDDTMTAAELGLEEGKVYEIKVFHAERKPEGSSFQLTLAGFNAGRSTCVATCGDAIIAGAEQCDNGTDKNTGGHNGCNPDCTLGAFCGDGIVQAPEEECDDKNPNPPVGEVCAGCYKQIIH